MASAKPEPEEMSLSPMTKNRRIPSDPAGSRCANNLWQEHISLVLSALLRWDFLWVRLAPPLAGAAHHHWQFDTRGTEFSFSIQAGMGSCHIPIYEPLALSRDVAVVTLVSRQRWMAPPRRAQGLLP